MFDTNYMPYLPQDRGSRGLDLGCGSGRLLAVLLDNGFENVVGIDIDRKVIDAAPARLRDRMTSIDDLTSYLAQHEGEFDFIIAKDVLYYFPRHEIRDRMREIAQALKPGGVILAEVFNAALVTASYTAAKDLGIQTMYTEHSLRQLLEAGDLEVIAIFGIRSAKRGFRRALYNLAAGTWRWILRVIQKLERGIDPQNPRILTKSLLGVARRRPRG